MFLYLFCLFFMYMNSADAYMLSILLVSYFLQNCFDFVFFFVKWSHTVLIYIIAIVLYIYIFFIIAYFMLPMLPYHIN